VNSAWASIALRRRCGSSVRLFIAVLALLNWTNSTIRTFAQRVQDSAKKLATNSFVAGAEMKIKRAIATTAILGGLASLAYAQRPSATCPLHGVSGHPTGAPSMTKGNASTNIQWMGAIQLIIFERLATTKRVVYAARTSCRAQVV